MMPGRWPYWNFQCLSPPRNINLNNLSRHKNTFIREDSRRGVTARVKHRKKKAALRNEGNIDQYIYHSSPKPQATHHGEKYPPHMKLPTSRQTSAPASSSTRQTRLLVSSCKPRITAYTRTGQLPSHWASEYSCEPRFLAWSDTRLVPTTYSPKQRN